VRFVRAGTSETAPWLSATKVNNGYAVVVDATNLTAGTYNAQAVVSGGWPAQDIQVPIALTLGEGLVLPADQLKVIGSESTASTLNGTVPVDVVAGPAVNWTAQSFAPWLILTDNAGATGETLAYRIDPDQLSTLANDGTEVSGGITITPSRSTMSPRTFAVRVSKRLAAVTHVGPYLQPAGSNTRVILRGYGFDSVGNLAARLQFSGGTVTQITRVNDTELIVKTGPLGLGTFPFSFTNALNVTTATAAVKTYMSQTFSATSMPTGGTLRGMFYDAERSSVYLVNQHLESLQRFHFTNQWQLTSLPLPAIVSAGLTQDGSRLMVATSTSSQSRIRQLDPADMTVQLSSKDFDRTIASDWNGTIPTTNDGRSWFALGSGWNDMAYFDATSETMTLVKPTFNTSFYGGPGFAMSRDGERLMILQTGSNWQDMLYMDAADSVVKVNPANLQNNYRMSFSDDASRYLNDNYEVRDRDFALIGRLPSPLPRATGDNADRYVMRSVLSPDGSRVYAVAVLDNFYYQSDPARLYVFDSSTRQPASDVLPTLGYMNIAAQPTCSPLPPNTTCYWNSYITVSPDGNTVFIAGDSNFVVVPVANANLLPVASTPPPGVHKLSRGGFVPWRLTLQ
jgi:glutamine cyclotransferase